MRDVDIKLVHGDDWCGLYFDDMLVYENHSIDFMCFFSLLSREYADRKIADIRVTEYQCDINWLEERGSFPQKFKEVEY